MSTERFKQTWLALIFFACFAVPGNAASTGGCESFAWPLTTELLWMKNADAKLVVTDTKVVSPPQGALAVAMTPMSDVRLDVPASGKSKLAPEKELGAVIQFERVEVPGIYQVTLSHAAWIDVVQNGKTLAAVEHTGKTDCDGIRKSVRFDIGAGPFAIQITGASEPALKMILRKAS